MTTIPLDSPLLQFEREAWEQGLTIVCGVDEAGRGPLAGPVVVAAVAFPPFCTTIPAVFDSKQLSEKTRLSLREQILALPGILYSIIEVSPTDIDRLNILGATHYGMRQSVLAIPGAQSALIDGNPVKNFPIPAKNLIKGDARCAAIAAASILAKTQRDAIMYELAKSYPEYGFELHKGYPTAAHIAALQKFGPTPAHRRSFGPVKALLPPDPNQPSSQTFQPAFDF